MRYIRFHSFIYSILPFHILTVATKEATVKCGEEQRSWINVVLMLLNSLESWLNIIPTLVQRLMSIYCVHWLERSPAGIQGAGPVAVANAVGLLGKVIAGLSPFSFIRSTILPLASAGGSDWLHCRMCSVEIVITLTWFFIWPLRQYLTEMISLTF